MLTVSETETLPVPLHMDSTGTVRIARTRVTLDTVIGRFKCGDSPEVIAASFPTLSLADIYVVLGYYFRHQVDVDAYLRIREVEAAELRNQIEAQPGRAEQTTRLRAELAKRRSDPQYRWSRSNHDTYHP